MATGSRKHKAGKWSVLMALLLVASMLLVACGGQGQQAQPTATTPAMTEASPTPEAMAEESPTAMAEESPTAMAEETPAADATPKPEASKEGTLTLWVHESILQAMTDAGKKFTDQYQVPVNVQLVAFGDIRDQLKLAGPAGEGPDIIVGAHDWLGELVANGLLEPLDLGDKAESFDPVSLQAFTYDGKLYGMPYGTETIALMYNKELVPNPPQTWQELKDIAKRLQDEGKVDQGYILQQGDPYHSYPFWTGHGSGVFGKTADGSYDPNVVLLDNEGGIAAMREIDQMVKDGLLRKDITGDIQKSLFLEGKSAMWFTGPWNLADVRKSAVGDKYAIAPIPPMETTSRPFVGVQGFMVSAFGKNKPVAQAFLTEFVATDETQQEMYEAAQRIPVWKSVADRLATSDTAEDKDIAAFAQSAAQGEPMPAIPAMSQVWTDWTKALELVFQQQQDPEGAIKDAANSIREKVKAGP